MFEFHKKEDILIPFDKIGSEDWETNTKLIIDEFTYFWNRKPKETISEEAIVELEIRLGTTLPASLKLFYKTFGLADIGEGLQNFETMGYIKKLWDYHPYGPDFTEEDKIHLPYLISFSDYLGNGNMFCFHSETKEIYYYDHEDSPYLTKMFDTVDDYIKGCLIYAQRHFFVQEVDEKLSEKWAEEILGDLLGKDIVRKWHYG